MAEINEAIIRNRRRQDPPDEPPADRNEENQVSTPPTGNKGTLILDATCAPANIHFPTDTGLLNKAREVSERLIDALWIPSPGDKKPRTYLNQVRRNQPR